MVTYTKISPKVVNPSEWCSWGTQKKKKKKKKQLMWLNGGLFIKVTVEDPVYTTGLILVADFEP